MNNDSLELPWSPSLTATQLKLFAMACMLIDHIGAFLLPEEAALYPLCRTVGRLAFPIFCYLIAEGAERTRSLPRYMARLGLFALVSTPPYNAVHGNPWYALDQPNVFFTLLLGLTTIFTIKQAVPWLLCRLPQPRLAGNRTVCLLLGLPICALLYLAAYAWHTDYGGYGVIAILLFWLLREHPAAAWGCFALITFVGYDFRLVQYIGGRVSDYCRMTPYDLCAHRVWLGGYTFRFQNARQMAATLAMLPCLMYHGEKGRCSGWGKWAFYAFYPLHLTVIWLIQIAIVFFSDM